MRVLLLRPGGSGAQRGVVAALGTRLLGAAPERIVIGGVSHLRWSFGVPKVLLVGHHDTVWPMGSIRTRPWSVAGGRARGPGVLDMKAGLVQMFHALASLPSPEGVCVIVNGDEEVGSTTSRRLIEESAAGCAAAFVLEASADDEGALKTARKGTSRYEIVVHGKAAHAGQEPEKGVNATIEAAHQVLSVAGLGASAAAAAGGGPLGAATITPTLLSAGSARNTVPALARLTVDVRAPSAEAQETIDVLVRGMTPRVPGARLEVRGGGQRPPMGPESSAALFALASRVAADQGQEPLRGDGCRRCLRRQLHRGDGLSDAGRTRGRGRRSPRGFRIRGRHPDGSPGPAAGRTHRAHEAMTCWNVPAEWAVA